MTTEEIWIPIEGYEQYEVSNFGRVRKIWYINTWVAKNVGYPQFQVVDDKDISDKTGKKKAKGKPKKMLLHRVLANAFIPNPDNKPFVNHKDGNKENNSLENLEWVTASENNYHAYRIGLNKGGRSQQNQMVVQVNERFEVEKIWKGMREIVQNGFTWNKVYDSMQRGVWYKKSKWYYIDFHYNYREDKYFIKSGSVKGYLQISDIEQRVLHHHNSLKEILKQTPPSRLKKPVAVLHSNGSIRSVYSSILEASEKTGADRAEIGKSFKTGGRVKGIHFVPATEADYNAYLQTTNQLNNG
jgi:hypothetical protein